MMNSWIFLLLFPLTYAGRNARYVKYNPPVVYPSEDHVTVQARSTYRLTCEGNRPVNWHLPGKRANFGNRVSITYSKNMDEDRSYITDLVITNMVYMDTGSYRCSFNDTTDETSIDANTYIHLYVYDQVHLINCGDFEFVQFVQYETAVIPCKTTHPNVSVELTYHDEKIIPDNKYIQFNPKIGYTISPVLLEHQGLYRCHARFENKEKEHMLNLRVLPENNYVPPPQINKTSGEHVTVGQTLVLTCSITVDWSIQVRLAWDVPNKSHRHGRLNLPDPVSKNVTIGGKPLKVVSQDLVIAQVAREDQGVYICNVTDHSRNSKSKSEFIRIYERNQSFLQVWQEGTKTVQKPGGRDESVQWVVNIQGHPLPSVTWYDPDGNVIPEGEDKERGRVVQTAGGKDVRSMLRLRGLELEDSGDYKVKVENKFNIKWDNLTLIVTETPKVSVMLMNAPESGLFHYGKLYTIRCSARGYPRPRVDWTFVACDTYDKCDKRPENLANTRENTVGRFQVDSTLDVVAAKSGRYTCIANSGKNAEFATVNFFVTGVNNGFEIRGENTVLEGEMVELLCSASKYNYTENTIGWYRQTVNGPEEIKNSRNPDIELYNDRSSPFDIVKGLKFRNVKLVDSGKYSCRARDPDTNGPRRRHNIDTLQRKEDFELRVKPYKAPHMYKTNMYGNETLVFGKGEGTRLYCKVGGTHMPQIEWYKNGERIIVPHDNINLLDSNQTLSIGVVVQEIDEGTYRCEAENAKGRVSATQTVVKVSAPSIYQTNLLGEIGNVDNKAKMMEVGESLQLQCRVLGRPRPTVLWTLNGGLLAPPHANITDHNQTLIIENVGKADSGRYECTAANSGGSTSVFQNVQIEEASLMATIYATGIAIPVFIAVGVAVILAILLILFARMCLRSGRLKDPSTPPTPRLTQFDLPDDEHEAESCRLTLSRDGSPFVNTNMNMCHGCTGCTGACHQCSGCHYNFNGIYGCTTTAPPGQGPYNGAMYSSGGGSILGVRGCTPGPGYSPGSHGMNEFSMYSQHTLHSSRFNTIKREPSTHKQQQERRSASPRLSAEF